MLAGLVLSMGLHIVLGQLAHGRPGSFPSPPPLVVVDPGHGGKDEGASDGGVREDRINLETARALAGALRRHGYRVLLTRDRGCNEAVYGDGPLHTREQGGCD